MQRSFLRTFKSLASISYVLAVIPIAEFTDASGPCRFGITYIFFSTFLTKLQSRIHQIRNIVAQYTMGLN